MASYLLLNKHLSLNSIDCLNTLDDMLPSGSLPAQSSTILVQRHYIATKAEIHLIYSLDFNREMEIDRLPIRHIYSYIYYNLILAYILTMF